MTQLCCDKFRCESSSENFICNFSFFFSLWCLTWSRWRVKNEIGKNVKFSDRFAVKCMRNLRWSSFGMALQIHFRHSNYLWWFCVIQCDPRISIKFNKLVSSEFPMKITIFDSPDLSHRWICLWCPAIVFEDHHRLIHCSPPNQLIRVVIVGRPINLLFQTCQIKMREKLVFFFREFELFD